MADFATAARKAAKVRRHFMRNTPYSADTLDPVVLLARLAGSTSFVRVDPDGRRYPVRFGPPEGGWPTMPKLPPWHPPKPPARPRRVSPFTGGARDPIEVLSRLAGSTTFKVPSVGRSTRAQSIGNDDIAHALGAVRDPLCQRLALAIACQTVAEWKAVQTLAYPLVLKHLSGNHNTRALVTGWRRYRVRLVLHDVFHDLVLMREPAWKDAAKRVRMRRSDYRDMHESIAGYLEGAAQTGAGIACRVLFGEE